LESFEKVKKSWSHELKCASNHDYENARCQVERRTHNHWHGRLETYPLCYSMRLMPLDWPTDCFIGTVSCEMVWWNKFWDKKIHWWLCSNFLFIHSLNFCSCNWKTTYIA